MYLVYEKNYLNYGGVDCVEETDMKLWKHEVNAVIDMYERKEKYISDKDNDFTFMENESDDKCFVFADELCKNNNDRSGEFHICMVELYAND